LFFYVLYFKRLEKSILGKTAIGERIIGGEMHRRKYSEIITARFGTLNAIKFKCRDCCAGSLKDVRLCPCLDCSLWEYRFGEEPTLEIAEKAAPVSKVLGRDK